MVLAPIDVSTRDKWKQAFTVRALPVWQEFAILEVQFGAVFSESVRKGANSSTYVSVRLIPFPQWRCYLGGLWWAAELGEGVGDAGDLNGFAFLFQSTRERERKLTMRQRQTVLLETMKIWSFYWYFFGFSFGYSLWDEPCA